MNELIKLWREAFEAIVVIEEDSPAAYGAAKLIAQESLLLNADDAEAQEHLPHGPNEPCEVCNGPA